MPCRLRRPPARGNDSGAAAIDRGGEGELRPLDVTAGDRILFGKSSGTEVKLDGEELLIMKEADVMGVLASSAATK